MKKINGSFLILAAIIITLQITVAGCNKQQEVSTSAKDSTVTTTTTVQTTTAQGPINQGQTPIDPEKKASNQKIVSTKERDIRNKKIGDDRHMRDTTTIRNNPTMPLTKDEQNTIMKQNEADAKRKEIERRKRMNQ